ncbi:MAG: hypothetical protein E7602_01675 [Ruminococcaceae bacterium]|nr:hypothetical protein [Oscillospiraceae bacterium]
MKKLFLAMIIAVSLLLVMAVAVCAEQITVVDGTDDITLGDCVIEGLDREIPKPSAGFTFVLDTETNTAKATAWANKTDETLGKVFCLPSTVTYGDVTYTVTSFSAVGAQNVNNRILDTVVIPDTVTAIPDNAFDSCRAMRYVYVGSGVETIGKFSFRNVGFTADNSTDENGEGVGNVREFIWKTTKVTTLTQECFYHMDFNVENVIEFPFDRITTYEASCMAYNPHAFQSGHKFNRQLYLDVFDITGATSVSSSAFDNAALAKTIVVRADQTNALSPQKLRGQGTAQPGEKYNFVVVGGETANTAKTLTGSLWIANAWYWGGKNHCTFVFRGYVNAYDGIDGLENQNGYGTDVVDYFFDSKETYEHYIASIDTTTERVATYTRYAKNNKGYFNYCVIDENGNHTFKAFNLKYTPASEGVEESISFVEYAQSSLSFDFPTYNAILDDDCTASNFCYCCDFMFSKGIEHVLNDAKLLYLNGYTKAGVKRVTCANDGCMLIDDVEIPSLFVTKGYSKDTTSNGIHFDFSVNNDAIATYEAYLQQIGDSVSTAYGVVVAIADIDDDETNDKLFDSDGALKSGVLEIKFGEKDFTNIKIKLTGIGENNYDTALHISGYFVLNGEVTYINDAGTSEYAQKVTYNSLPNE